MANYFADDVAHGVCMNPTMDCRVCVFQDGHLAKWCPPAERTAKAFLDLTVLEVAA